MCASTRNIAPDVSTAPRFISVAVGILTDREGRVLVARRAAGKPGAGLWEFPGGKREAGESRWQALTRELDEELGIVAQAGTPLMRLPSCVEGAGSVVLDVWRVTAFSGTPTGREGQPLKWVTPAELDALPMPPANDIIRRAHRLPSRYLITPPDAMPLALLVDALHRAVAEGVKLIQIRRPRALPGELAALAEALLPARREQGVTLLLNGAPEQAHAWGYDGVHLNGARLAALTTRPPAMRWIAASCHGPADLDHAATLGLDFAVLSPVRFTPDHAAAPPLGWRRWARQVRGAALPVYALGGVGPADIPCAQRLGGQGIAAIRAFWPVPEANP
jgi:8-oxo-dGTP diphosphatase